MVMLKQLFILSAFLLLLTSASPPVLVEKETFETFESHSYLLSFFSRNPTISDCSNDNDILQIEYIKINPDPPKKGKSLEINARGYLTERVDVGSYVDITVKLGLIKLLSQRMDLCEQVEKVDKKCPLEAGPQTLQKTVELPKEIPPGKYFVDAFVYTSDHRRIACLKAQTFFGPI
ncbi:2861_t:CDS:2 [Ambispora gerdemannii]|uniref:Phosphatidylglycerol/phosphatidylinositol transfer protein n=1 Tax=Ambispora gerdemannii TaxID=144530 RepID=A0A9N9GYS2_9GLOM|nr:2861_t:CDS:2 [Ambispora gerdemannii]